MKHNFFKVLLGDKNEIYLPIFFQSKITIIGIKLATTYTESTFLKHTFGKKKSLFLVERKMHFKRYRVFKKQRQT